MVVGCGRLLRHASPAAAAGTPAVCAGTLAVSAGTVARTDRPSGRRVRPTRTLRPAWPPDSRAVSPYRRVSDHVGFRRSFPGTGPAHQRHWRGCPPLGAFARRPRASKARGGSPSAFLGTIAEKAKPETGWRVPLRAPMTAPRVAPRGAEAPALSRRSPSGADVADHTAGRRTRSEPGEPLRTRAARRPVGAPTLSAPHPARPSGAIDD